MQALRYLLLLLFLSTPEETKTEYRYIRQLQDVRLTDLNTVGGKNASLGQMISALSEQGIRVPQGFAVTVDGYALYMDYNNLTEQIINLTNQITDIQDLKTLKSVSEEIRTLIENGEIPQNLADEIQHAYHDLSTYYHEEYCDVAVRSSATAEDLPNASFAGQQDTFLHVQGPDSVLTYYKKCIASLLLIAQLRIAKNKDLIRWKSHYQYAYKKWSALILHARELLSHWIQKVAFRM